MPTYTIRKITKKLGRNPSTFASKRWSRIFRNDNANIIKLGRFVSGKFLEEKEAIEVANKYLDELFNKEIERVKELE